MLKSPLVMLYIPGVDVLSSALEQMKVISFVSGVTDVGGNWAVSFPAYQGFKLQLILNGECWIRMTASGTTHHLKAGDCTLMTKGEPFVMGTDLSVLPIPYASLASQYAKSGGSIEQNGGGDLLLIGVHFEVSSHLPQIVFNQMPPLIHLQKEIQEASVMRWSIEQFRSEFAGTGPGRTLILRNLAPIMLSQALRVYLGTAKNDKNWATALSDPKLAKALEAMHFRYQYPWSVEELANVCSMSRSGFCLAFKTNVGVTPLEYLTNWRMQMATELLRSDQLNVADVASAVGYESESAFSATFKRIFNCRPGTYRKQVSVAMAH